MSEGKQQDVIARIRANMAAAGVPIDDISDGVIAQNMNLLPYHIHNRGISITVPIGTMRDLKDSGINIKGMDGMM